VKKAAVVLALLLASAVPAEAAEPLVPRGTQDQVRSILEQFNAADLAYIPTSAPAHFGFIGFTVNQGSTNFRLADSRYPATGFNQRPIFVSVDPFKGKRPACIRGYKQKLNTGGAMVYFRGTTAWRCILSPRGRMVRIFAESSYATGKQLGVMLGSFKLLR
jgi:hypothetical protein